MKYLNDLITIDSEVQFGTPVFTNTRVPVEILFQYLEAGDGLHVFLEAYPSVKKEQAVSLLSRIESFLTPDVLMSLDARAA